MSKPFKNIFPDDITLEYTVYVALLEKYTLHLLSLCEKNCIGLVLTCVSLQSITKCDIFLKEESTIYH